MSVESATLMNSDWSSWLTRWSEAGLIDGATADRIRTFEQARGGQRRLRWPIIIALAFGGLMVGGGILLFVAAHWDALSPAMRFTTVLMMVGGLHVGGALAADRFPAMSVTLHAIGTIALGAGIALSGQIFNLDEHWPGGIMMWALGAGLAAWLLRDSPQIVFFAILGPLWLGAEWIDAHGPFGRYLDEMSASILAGGGVALALTYLSAVTATHHTHIRRALMWTGGMTLPPLAVGLAFATADDWTGTLWPITTLLIVGSVVAIGLPLGLAFGLRGRDAWQNALAMLWIGILVVLGQFTSDLPLFAWWAVGAIGLVAWGVAEARVERINLGAVAFAATVLTFYFSQVMDKLGRSASLIGLGLLFLGGGWALERLRRRLVGEVRGEK
jgi:uncharacterized membrane protein